MIKVEKLDGEVGDKIGFDQVLMVGDEGTDDSAKFGTPIIAGAEVTAEVPRARQRRQGAGSSKKKRRKNYRRTRGHRQWQTVLRISDIKVA